MYKRYALNQYESTYLHKYFTCNAGFKIINPTKFSKVFFLPRIFINRLDIEKKNKIKVNQYMKTVTYW